MSIKFQHARQARILNLLMQSTHPLTSQYFARYFNISERIIRYDIQNLKQQLVTYPCHLHSIRGIGYQLEGSIKQLQAEIKKELGDLYYYDNIDTKDKFIREQLILRYLLFKNNIVTTRELISHFYITRATLKEDITRASETIEPYHMKIYFLPYKGVYLEGTEINKRMLLARETAFYKESPLITYIQQELNFIHISFEDFIEYIKQTFHISLSHIEAYNLYNHIWIMFYRIWKGIYVSSEIIQNNQYCQKYIPYIQKWIHSFQKYLNFPEQELYYLILLILSSGPHDNQYIPPHEIQTLVKSLEKQTNVVLGKSFINDLSQLLIPILIKSKNQICSNSVMIREIKKRSPLSIDLAYRLSVLIQDQYHIDLFDNDICSIAYVILRHLHSQKTFQPYTIIVTTSVGKLLSQDLLYKLQSEFPYIRFIYKELYEMNNISLNNVFFIISDTFIETSHLQIPVLKINLMYTKQNILRIGRYISRCEEQISQDILSNLDIINDADTFSFLKKISQQCNLSYSHLLQREQKITFETNHHCVIICDYTKEDKQSRGWYHPKGIYWKNEVIHYFFYINIFSHTPFHYLDIVNYLYQIDSKT